MAFSTIRSRRWARVLAKIAVAAALLGLFYLAIANLLLAAALRSLAREPGATVRYRRAYTVLPGRIHIDRLEIGQRGPRPWRARLEQADLRMSLSGLLRGTGRVTHAEADVSALEIGDHEVTGRMQAQAEDVVFGRGLRSLRSGSLVVEEGRIRREGLPARPAPFRGWIAARGLTLSEEEGLQLTGTVHLESADAGALLDVANLPAAARWTLEGLDGQPVTAGADIEVRQDGVTLRDLHANSDAAEVRGTLHRRAGLHDGAFLVRRGRWTTGIELSANRVTVVLSPDDGWLSRKARLPPPP